MSILPKSGSEYGAQPLSRTIVRSLLGLFFLSGFAALLYQVVWQRMLVFYTGSDTVSISLIVTAFMSGLGLGYLVGGKLADRVSPARNLLYFVLAELGILLFALFSTTILYDWLYLNGPSPGESMLVLYMVVVSVLLVPTFLMGVSLPVLSRAFRREEMTGQARYISRLYFVNTLGAAIGALVTGVFLVRILGYEDSLWVGIIFNGLCVVGAMILMRYTSNVQDGSPTEEPRPQPLQMTRSLMVWSAQYALSGFAALSLELIWFRVLETLIKSVSLTFSILLAIYLGSMAIGTALGPRLMRRLDQAGRERLFLRAQALIYMYTGAAFLFFITVIGKWDALGFLWDYFGSYEPDFTVLIAVPTYVLIPLFLMAVPTFLMGLSFSVSQALIQDRWDEVGRKVGWLQFVNIVGSALGAWWVTWVGFNVLGTGLLVKVVSCLGLLYVLVLLLRKHSGWTGAVVSSLVILTVVVALPGNFQFWRTLNGIQEDDRFMYDENESGLSVIKRMDHGGATLGVVFANGLGQSSMPYHPGGIHTRLGALGVLLHPNPEKVAVIGLGSGATLHGMACRSETQDIVCFEIMSNQPKVLRQYAERHLDTAVLSTLNDPRLRMITHDGRYRLTTMPDTYDVIEADALRPNSAFSGNIYSEEYFQLLRSRLKPGGIAVSWCPTPRVLASFCQVFPYVAYAKGFVLMGSDTPIRPDWPTIRLRMQHPFTMEHFANAGIDINTLLLPMEEELVAVDPVELGHGETNTDLFPRDEFALPYDSALIRRKIRSALGR